MNPILIVLIIVAAPFVIYALSKVVAAGVYMGIKQARNFSKKESIDGCKKKRTGQ